MEVIFGKKYLIFQLYLSNKQISVRFQPLIINLDKYSAHVRISVNQSGLDCGILRYQGKYLFSLLIS